MYNFIYVEINRNSLFYTYSPLGYQQNCYGVLNIEVQLFFAENWSILYLNGEHKKCLHFMDRGTPVKTIVISYLSYLIYWRRT